MSTSHKRLTNYSTKPSLNLTPEEHISFLALCCLRDQSATEFVTKLVRNELSFYQTHVYEFLNRDNVLKLAKFCEKHKLKLSGNDPLKIKALLDDVQNKQNIPVTINDIIESLKNDQSK